jgi:hypothetical protein
VTDELSNADLGLYEVLWDRVAGRDENEFNAEERAYYHAEHVNMEAQNGGLVQYFMNTRGEEIADARAALRAIGADHHAAVFDRAVAIWEEERARPDSCWADDLDDRAFSESRIADLDGEWYAVDLIPIELGYARANPASFGLSA